MVRRKIMKPALPLMCGMAGSGKTPLAKKIEAAQSAVRFSPDEWIEKLLSDIIDREENERLRVIVEAIQWETAQRLLSLVTNIILENGFWGRSEREMYRDRARELGARVELHFLDLSDDELWQRIEKRNGDLPARSFQITRVDLAEWMTWFQKPDEAELKTYDNRPLA